MSFLQKNGSICHLYPLIRIISNIGDPPPFTRTPKKKTTLNIGIFGLCKLCQSPMSQVQFRKSFPMKEGRRYLIGYPVDLDPLSIFWVMVDGHGGFCYNWTCYDLGLLNPISNLPSNLAWIMMWHINVNLTPKHWVYLYNRDILGGKSSTAPKKVPRFCSGIMERDETYAVRTWCLNTQWSPPVLSSTLSLKNQHCLIFHTCEKTHR